MKAAARLLSIGLFLLYVLFSMRAALDEFRNNFDIVAYVGLVYERAGHSPAEVQKLTFDELERKLPRKTYERIVGQGGYGEALATDPEALRQNLSWYKPRPL